MVKTANDPLLRLENLLLHRAFRKSDFIRRLGTQPPPTVCRA
jgi:hypothetical protein